MQEADYLKDITEIRSIMERSSRFISLSGLSGVFAGIFALAGAAAAYFYLNLGTVSSNYDGLARSTASNLDDVLFITGDALLVLFLSISVAIILSSRRARKAGQTIWDKTAKRLVLNLMIPLAAGGIFCLALLFHGAVGLVAPSTLIFYGLALLNGSKYTLNDIRYLGVCEIVLGLISSFFVGYGLIFWAIGFGILHIIYGTAMYQKYESGK